MKLILNIGMHKTGSSSIQKSLHRYVSDTAAYLDVGHPNHSAVFMTMFRDNPESYVAHKKNKRSLDDVVTLRNQFREQVESFVTANPGRNIIASGEDIVLLSKSESVGMKTWFDRFFDDYLIVGYVRPPVSLMSSAVQQRIAGGASIRIAELYPNYRDRLEKFDHVFGHNNVVLTKFARDTLTEGDVVTDFLAKAGLDPSTVDIQRDNEGRSLEASAVLFAQRKFGQGFGRYPSAPRDNRRVAELLRSIGSTPVRLHSDFVGPILTDHADDLAWIEARLGAGLVDQPTDEPGAVRSAADLVSRAGDHLPAVARLLEEEARALGPTRPELVAQAVDLLFELVRERRRKGSGENGPKD